MIEGSNEKDAREADMGADNTKILGEKLRKIVWLSMQLQKSRTRMGISQQSTHQSTSVNSVNRKHRQL